MIGLERGVVGDLRRREGDAPLRADAHGVPREVVFLEYGVATSHQPVVEHVEMLVGLACEDFLQARARRGHRQWVPVVCPHLIDLVVVYDFHDLFAAADGAGGETTPERLGHGDHVRQHAELLGRATRGDTEAGLDLVENQDYAKAFGDLAYRLEIPRLGQNHAQIHHGWFHDDAGRWPPFVEEAL